MGRHEHFHHQADIGVRGYGDDPAEAFAQAGLALTAVMVPPGSVRHDESVLLELTAEDLDILLYDFLNVLIYATATRGLLFGAFELDVDRDAAGWRLRGTAQGERIDPARHAPTVEVKAATFTALTVERRFDGEWLAQCVVDV